MADEPKGVPFIGKGWGVAIPQGGLTLRVDDDGNIAADPIRLQTRIEFWPMWYQIALEHAELSAKARRDLLVAQEKGDNQGKATAIEDEMRAGLVTIVACAIVWDSVYEIVGSVLTKPPEFNRRTARWKRIVQVLHRGFCLPNARVKELREFLRLVFLLRDEGVHPSSKYEDPVLSPITGTGLPASYSRFRAENATEAVRGTWWIYELSDRTRHSEPEVARWAGSIPDRLPNKRPEFDVPDGA